MTISNQKHEEMILAIKTHMTKLDGHFMSPDDVEMLMAKFPEDSADDFADALEDAADRLKAEAEQLRGYVQDRNAPRN